MVESTDTGQVFVWWRSTNVTTASSEATRIRPTKSAAAAAAACVITRTAKPDLSAAGVLLEPQIIQINLPCNLYI